MAKNSQPSRSLVDPQELAPIDEDHKVQVVIETPKASRNLARVFAHDE
jgi:hypothetical protein